MEAVSKRLGRSLPERVRSRISGEGGPLDLVVPLLSVDDRGMPYPALLSLYELILWEGDLYFHLSQGSRSSSNLKSRRVVCLLFVEASGCFYLQGHARYMGEFSGRSVFRLDLTDVLEDFPTPEEGTAFLVSSTRFQADEESIRCREELRAEILDFLAEEGRLR